MSSTEALRHAHHLEQRELEIGLGLWGLRICFQKERSRLYSNIRWGIDDEIKWCLSLSRGEKNKRYSGLLASLTQIQFHIISTISCCLYLVRVVTL